MSKEAKVGYKKNIGTILLLSFAGSIIYGLPYFRSYYYDTYQAMYHLLTACWVYFLILSVEYWPIKSRRKNCLFFR